MLSQIKLIFNLSDQMVLVDKSLIQSNFIFFEFFFLDDVLYLVKQGVFFVFCFWNVILGLLMDGVFD